MALLVLFSTMSFTVDKHFCGSFLVDQAVFSEAQTCHMKAAPEGMTSEKDCCDEQKVLVEGQKDLKISFDDLEIPQQVFIAGLTFSYLSLFEGIEQQSIPFADYSPPILVYDIHLLDQTFLI